MNELWKARLASAMRECDTHLERIARSRKLLAAFFPLEPARVGSLSEEQVEHVDQFIFRFAKLQDAIGTRLYPALRALLDDDDSPLPFLDVLAKLEKYGIVPDSQIWQFFRNLRNNFAHDYPEKHELTAAGLNTLYARWQDFEELYLRARGYIEANRESLLGPQ